MKGDGGEDWELNGGKKESETPRRFEERLVLCARETGVGKKALTPRGKRGKSESGIRGERNIKTRQR